METKPAPIKKEHFVHIDNRSKASMNGVNKVISSCDNTILLDTSEGGLTVLGSSLKIVKFDAVIGELSFEGVINRLTYSAAKEPLMKRLFK